MLEVLFWRWYKPGYRSSFSVDTVNVGARMVARAYPHPHRVTVITDQPDDAYAPGIRVIPISERYADLVNPSRPKGPSCYRRLEIFSEQARTKFGERVVSVDLDFVAGMGDLSPVWDRPEDFVIWGATHPTTPYNGSMVMLKTGTRRQVWDLFDPLTSPAAGRSRRHFGSDQAWIAACLGPNEARWGVKDGVYSFRNHIAPAGGHLPGDARIVFFHGKHDPWTPEIQRDHPWVAQHWR